MSATPNKSPQLTYAWPLPGALLPNGHISWAEWVARQEPGTFAHPSRQQALSLAGGAWDREARLLIVVAATYGVTVHAEDLINLDVHDLQALRRRITGRHDGHDKQYRQGEHAA